MDNWFDYKVILKISQAKGSRIQNMGALASPFSSFSPFFKDLSAGVTDSAGLSFYNFSHIYALTNSNASATSTRGYLIGRGYG